MLYITITLDIGTDMNAFKLVWYHHDLFLNVVTHPGDFQKDYKP